MNDRTLIAAGALGAVLLALCCAAPVLVVLLGGVGIAAWLGGVGSLAISAALALVAVLFVLFYVWRTGVSRGGTAPKDEIRNG